MTKIKVFTFNPFSENTYVLSDEQTREAIVFDPGCYGVNECKMLRKYITDNDLQVKRLINTHCHLDHIFGNPFVIETWGVGLECHENELPILNSAEISGLRFGTPVPTQTPPSVFLADGDIVRLGAIDLEVILAPGHSPGSLCFYNATEKYLIAGDVLFFGSIGRTDLPLGNSAQLIHSIQTRLLPLPDDVKVYSGHGPATTIGRERYSNPFLN
jgi:glyoxylase-like metal-dependent hydrolase (beta-lactamase superfamily II)